ncbi:hypothetical protein BN1708_006089 [Verticillium longisporum]|uniref:G-protein coupled receptors family 1 profile domain-containing protein n=1 Tax=Verticillium longisporum TaxID=100787 RepID=A0A0G4MHC3_VERLO|nr:hypothetical protein BN1708_006089 [Verticillium longisporum]
MSDQVVVPGLTDIIQPRPPYLSPFPVAGLIPNTSTDVPVSAVLLVLYLTSILSNILILRQNKGRGRPFPFQVLLIIYSVFRIVALTLRISYAAVPDNINLAIAANIISNAGVIVIFVLNLLVSPRLMRRFFGVRGVTGWRRKISTIPFFAAIPFLPIMLLTVVNVTILTYFTNDPKVRLDCLTAQKVASVTFVVIAFLPAPFAATVAILSSPIEKQHRQQQAEKEATGSFASRVIHPDDRSTGTVRGSALLMAFGSAVLTVGAAYRTTSILSPRRMPGDPAWYHERPAYYCFNYMLELIVVAAYLIFRFDQRFREMTEEEQEAQGTLVAPSYSDRKDSEEAVASRADGEQGGPLTAAAASKDDEIV